MIELRWGTPLSYGLEGQAKSKALSFEGGQYNFSLSSLPFYYNEMDNAKNSKASIQIENTEWIPLTKEEEEIIGENNLDIPNNFQVDVQHAIQKKQHKSFLYFLPFRRVNGQLEKLNKIEYHINYSTVNNELQRQKSRTYAANSVLSSGVWYKIGVTKSGVFKLNYNFFKQLGIDISQMDPRQIRIYGNGGGMLPANNIEDRPDDLNENAIQVIGENDGVFNKNDYVLFYAQGPIVWRYDSINQIYVHRNNIYSDTAFYYLNFDLGLGKRIQKTPNPSASGTLVTTFDDYQFHEVDQLNLIKSGQRWYGETFDSQLSRNFVFEFPNLDVSSNGKVKISAIARSGVASTYNFSIGNTNNSMSVASTILTRYEVGFAKTTTKTFDFSPNGDLVNLNITYNKPQNSSKGWLDFIDVNVRRGLNFTNGQMSFRDRLSASGGISEYRISGNASFRVWDVSDLFNVNERTLIQSSGFKTFKADNSEVKEFVAFNAADTLNVFPIKAIQNQNLHGLSFKDLIIVTHPLFESQARELAQIHEQEGLRTFVVFPEHIYNEFSSGAQDPVAIRSFLKMFYDRAVLPADLPDYLLIIGDASYDFKNRISGNSNFVVSFQSANSLEPVDSYISDDYMALLDDGEGDWKFNGTNPELMDVSTGRFPVRTVEEAQGIVNKIKTYYQSSGLADWRNKIAFIGDDGDGVTHMSQSNQLANIVERDAKDFNVSKIFLDSYQRVSTAGGLRFPQANEEIKRTVQNGALFTNYTGHGGETGWAAERVLDIATINSWTNINQLSVFITATCEFSRFDDPLRTSAGEFVLLNPHGGGVGLLTTTRLVYSSPNYFLNQAFYNRVFDRLPDGSSKRLGDIMLETKNANASQSNTRNFSLLGDPALRIAIPQHNVVTTSINNKPINQIDTLRALTKAVVEGQVEDESGTLLNNFNGIIYPTVYDKEQQKKTLNNSGTGAYPYVERTNILFKGTATVTNGKFRFEFIIPKDISYNYGEGKITYYVKDDQVDGNGYTQDFIIGGSSSSSISDDVGPDIELYMNDESFIYGGMTNDDPILLAKLFDEQGINTVGNGIGHDIIAILDENTENAVNLNEYFQSEIDNYKRGELRYPLADLSDGKHTITLKAWDNANNSSERTIEFNVVSEKNVRIENLVNYPNPFTTNTEFIFQHNQPGIPMDVKLEIFTVSGKLVKSFDQVILSEGFLSRDIRWNGRDDFGDKIGKGVYVYKLKVRSRNGSVDEVFEKLVIL